MPEDLKIALIGLDSSHPVEFVRLMQAPDRPNGQRVGGMRAVSCMRFQTPFQDETGLDERQKQLEAWGVRVTSDFDQAVGEADAVMVEINDPSYHLEYFTRCVALGKRVFLDKPLADTIANGRKIADLAAARGVEYFSASSLRFMPELTTARASVPEAIACSVFGPLGEAQAGSSIVWYGVHAFEMLQVLMGRGARSVRTAKDELGAVVHVTYEGGRRGLVELTVGAYHYGGVVRTSKAAHNFVVDMSTAYKHLLVHVERFFRTGEPPVETKDTLEIMAMLDAAQRSADSERSESL